MSTCARAQMRICARAHRRESAGKPMTMYARDPSAAEVAAALASGCAVEIWRGGSARYIRPDELADELAAQGVGFPPPREGADTLPSSSTPSPINWPSYDDKERP